ncbi:MAG: hypothetical protein GX075_01540 [Firmicutes bacterium]|nr:hypothetical protein [Bacillota bacterium]
METLRAEALKTWKELNEIKLKIEKYRRYLIRGFYSGGTLLLMVFWWILFPPRQASWRLTSNICFVFLIGNLWVSYWLIKLLKSGRRSLGELRIKLRQLAWEKICDCEGDCDCGIKLEKAIAAELASRQEGFFTEVQNEVELS